jgi:hypothetical protein
MAWSTLITHAQVPLTRSYVSFRRQQRLCLLEGRWRHSHGLSSHDASFEIILSPIGRSPMVRAAADMPSSGTDGSHERINEHSKAHPGPNSPVTKTSALKRLQHWLFGGPVDKQKLAGYGIAGAISYGYVQSPSRCIKCGNNVAMAQCASPTKSPPSFRSCLTHSHCKIFLRCLMSSTACLFLAWNCVSI